MGDRVLRFKDTVQVTQSGRLAHCCVFGLKDFQHGAARLGAQVSGEQDAAARPVGEIPAGRADSAREQAVVESAKELLLRAWPRGPAGPQTRFGFEVVQEGGAVALRPELEAARNLGSNVFGAFDAVSRLEDHSNKHQGSLGVPQTFTDTFEFGAESLEKLLPDLPLRDEVAVGG